MLCAYNCKRFYCLLKTCHSNHNFLIETYDRIYHLKNGNLLCIMYCIYTYITQPWIVLSERLCTPVHHSPRYVFTGPVLPLPSLPSQHLTLALDVQYTLTLCHLVVSFTPPAVSAHPHLVRLGPHVEDHQDHRHRDCCLRSGQGRCHCPILTWFRYQFLIPGSQRW